GSVPEMIHSDPVRLHQILVNLVGNAIKFTEHGGVTLRLELLPANHTRPGPPLAVDVIDTRIGPRAADPAHRFEAFAQGDASLTRRHGGTGLGLTISRALARLLGGDLVVESTGPTGSVFRATIATGAIDRVRLIETLGTSVAAFRPTTPAVARP